MSQVYHILSNAFDNVSWLEKSVVENQMINIDRGLSLLIIEVEPDEMNIEYIHHYCQEQSIPLLLLLNEHLRLPQSIDLATDGLVDRMIDPNEAEILHRVHLLLRVRKEIMKRKKKEQELQKALTHLNEELAFAKKIQQLVLSKAFVEDDIQIKAIYEPSELLSGDLYYWTRINEGEYGLIIIDVSGHGVHAALISMAMRALFPGLLKRLKDPKQIAKELNRHMFRLFEEFSSHHYVTSYFTAIILHIHTSEKKIHYVNAGHQPGIIIEGDTMSTLSSTMVPIGLIKNPMIEKATFTYEHPSKLLLFTDGLNETPYNQTENRLEEVKQGFKQYFAYDDELMLKKLYEDRKKAGEIKDDLCAVCVSLR
jgi:sigma-B regulation protein RsbU (phosphoserine phosphatase)